MGKIKKLIEIRPDGEIISESMSISDIVSLGAPQKIVKIKWFDDLTPVSLENNFGLSSKIAPGDNFIVVNEHQENTEVTLLSILNPNGTYRLQIPNIQNIRNINEKGKFLWYENSRITLDNVFGIIFCRDRDNSMFQLDIDAASGTVVGTYPLH
jgi:hypothetical protein